MAAAATEHSSQSAPANGAAHAAADVHDATPKQPTREADAAGRESTSTVGRSLDLPSLLPLSHDHALLSNSAFDVDAFLLSRIHIPLDELRGELREYLGVLREELVQLINDDYEEFISLGTGLRGEGERLKRLRQPLADLRGEVEGVRDVLKEHQSAVQAKLDERSGLREEKALLDLLQRLFETLTRAEALEIGGDEAERPKIVARLAGEYTQLVYLRGKARAERCKIVETVSPRIDALRHRLSHELSSLLTSALEGCDNHRIKQALRTYDLIEGWHEAEDVVRKTVHEFCLRTVTPTALVVPPEPAAPETPFPPVKGKPFERPNRLPDASLLGGLYNRILAQVDTYDSLINIAHDVSPQFDFFSRVLWPEICTSISDNLGHVIFAAGRPDDLHKHYTTTYRFLTILESHAPTLDAVAAMRESSQYESFERRWQLPVYFQLRWKEIVSTFEKALDPNAPASSSVPAPWALPQSAAAWEAFKQCWAPETYIAELSHRFLRLSLQIVSRYGTWLNSQLATFTSDEQNDAALRFASSAVSDIEELSSRVGDLAALKELEVEVPLDSLSIKPYEEKIVSILERRCIEPVKFVKSVASQLRSAPARNAGATPAASHFVPAMLKPLHTFLEGRPKLRERYGPQWSAVIVEHILAQYARELASVRKTEDLLRRHRKQKKSGFALFGSSGLGGAGTPDTGDEEERFQRQMLADIDGLKSDALKLGVDVESIGAWAELKDVVMRASE